MKSSAFASVPFLALIALLSSVFWSVSQCSHLHNTEPLVYKMKDGQEVTFYKYAHFDATVPPLPEVPMRQLGRLLASCFPLHTQIFNSPEFLEKYKENTYDTAVIYFDLSGKPVAHGNVIRTLLANGFRFDYIHTLCLAEDLRNQGLGGQLLRDVVDTHMSHYNYDGSSAWLGLNVHQDHARSLSFYKRLGFLRGWILNQGMKGKRFLNGELPHKDMPVNGLSHSYSLWPAYLTNYHYPFLAMFKKYTDPWADNRNGPCRIY